MEESERSLQQARAGFCEAGLDPSSATGKGPWSEDWNFEDPVRPEIQHASEERHDVIPSRTEEEQGRTEGAQWCLGRSQSRCMAPKAI